MTNEIQTAVDNILGKGKDPSQAKLFGDYINDANGNRVYRKPDQWNDSNGYNNLYSQLSTPTFSTATDFVSSLPFIIFFLLLALLMGMFFGEEALYGFLLLILFSMAILNSDKFASVFTKFM